MLLKYFLAIICIFLLAEAKKPSRARCTRDTKIIRLDQICDGLIDCRRGAKKGADEKGCTERCRSRGVRIRGRLVNRYRSIPKKWVCDGERDCPDGSDERNCGNQILKKLRERKRSRTRVVTKKPSPRTRRPLPRKKKPPSTRRPLPRKKKPKPTAITTLKTGQVGVSSVLKEEIVDYHNQLRTRVAKGKIRGQPKATNMKLMYWDEAIAKEAQEWADNCDYRHEHEATGQSHCGVGGFHNLGENIGVYTIDKAESRVTARDLSSLSRRQIKAMFEEHKYWKFGKSGQTSCRLEPCGHYTQIVWADSEAIGCGISHCNRIKSWTPGATRHTLYLVCKYGPSGNIIGTYPYNRGSPCSECDGAPCIDGALCDSRQKPAEACEDSPFTCEAMRRRKVRGRFSCWPCEQYKKQGRCQQCFNQGRNFAWNLATCQKTCGFCGIKYKLTNKPHINTKPGR